MTRPSDARLNWLAVQYVLGELPEHERTAFEERLADDSTACEAVAEAAQLMMTLRASLSDVAIAPVSAPLPVQLAPRHSWVAFAGAATVAAGLMCAISFWPGSPRATQVAHVDRSAAELVSLWRTGSATVEASLYEADAEVAESGHEVAVPGWLLAAVSLEHDKAADGRPNDQQEGEL